MSQYSIKIDPRRLKNPDLDIRYRLFDYLNELFPGVLSDDGYDYEGDVPILAIFIKVKRELIGLLHEAIVQSILSFSEFGADFGQAVRILYDDLEVYTGMKIETF